MLQEQWLVDAGSASVFQAQREPLKILLVEDMATDIFLLKTAFQQARVPCRWHIVSHGQEAITVSILRSEAVRVPTKPHSSEVLSPRASKS